MVVAAEVVVEAVEASVTVEAVAVAVAVAVALVTVVVVEVAVAASRARRLLSNWTKRLLQPRSLSTRALNKMNKKTACKAISRT